MLAFDCSSFEFFTQLPPKLLGGLGPEQHPEPTLSRLGSCAPLVVHAAKPSEVAKEFVAKGGFKPGEILMAGGPSDCLALLAQRVPGRLTMATLHAVAHKIATLDG